MITAMISRLMILAFGTLYPAYASYKAVRTKDVKEYVKWMMYWIVFALFTCAETFTDVFFSFWFPFYYEIKVALVFWLLSPATKGSSFLYRNFVHPALQRRETEIDEMLSHAKEKGYNTVLSIGSKGVTYATNVLLQTAMRGGGGLVEQIKKSYSLTDLAPKVSSTAVLETTDAAGQGTATSFWNFYFRQYNSSYDKSSTNQTNTSIDFLEASRPIRGRRGIAGSAANLEMRFSEVDVNIRQCPPNDLLSDIRSSEDISSGYSSTDQLYTEGVLTRSSSVSSTKARGRGGRTAQSRRTPLTEDSEGSDDDFAYTSSVYPTEFFPPKTPSSTSKLSVHLESAESSQQNELSIKLEKNKLEYPLSQVMSAISEEPHLESESHSKNYENLLIDTSTIIENQKNKDNIQNVTDSDESEQFVEKYVDLSEKEKDNITDVDKSLSIIQLGSKSDVRSSQSSEHSDRDVERREGIVTGILEIPSSLRKSSSQISVTSVTSSATSLDCERKGKYKKMPAPRPPSREIEETTFKELPELEQKLSDTEALMKKISAVGETNSPNSELKETLV